MLIHLVIGLVVSYILISLIEWYAHKYEMHRPGWLFRLHPNTFLEHQKIHHPTYQTNFESADPAEHADTGTMILLWFNLKFFIVPLGLIALVLPIEVIVFLFLAVIHAILWNIIHPEMHKPSGRWFGKTRLFAYLKHYHRMHHENWATNFNVVAIGADHVFGTHYKEKPADGDRFVPDLEVLDERLG